MLPFGVDLQRLTPNADSRGSFTELFRDSWGLSVAPVQWNSVRSEANVLRGVHAHWRHADYLTVVVGRAAIGLHDLREGSPTEGFGGVVELDAAAPAGLSIPPGVAHGFYFHEQSLHVYAVSHEWDPEDELGCRWDAQRAPRVLASSARSSRFLTTRSRRREVRVERSASTASCSLRAQRW